MDAALDGRSPRLTKLLFWSRLITGDCGLRIYVALGWFLAGAATILALMLLAHERGYLIVFPEGERHVELLSLFLGAATLIITAVAMIVAIGAVVGYTAIRDAAEVAGREAGDRAARELLAPIVSRGDALAQLLATRPQEDRTEELTAALAERGNDNGPAHD